MHASGEVVVRVPTTSVHAVGSDPLTLEALADVAHRSRRVTLDAAARERMLRSRAVIDDIEQGGEGSPVVYGVNTGFGYLANVRIASDQIRELQLNLIRSHASGLGPSLDEPAVRAMLLLRASVLALGLSGVRPEVCELLIEMLNRGVHPVIPSKGSVGASGDLAPLAHLALVLIGEGEALLDGVRLPGDRALRRVGLEPIVLRAKEGLSLVNGTQFIGAVGGLALKDAEDTARIADAVGALSLVALRGTARAFDPRIHSARPHHGQGLVARNMRRLLVHEESGDSSYTPAKLQDAYSLRCIPQVHGATRDALAYARKSLEIEMMSATDNPLVFPDTGELVSGGNFHGQPLAIALDCAGIAVAELANIAERRMEQLMNPSTSNGLPAFLIAEPGLNSGYMMAQVTAAALVSENKVLAHPASVDSISTSAGQEDHVSMGAHAARKLRTIVDNVRDVLAIELLASVQAMDLRAHEGLSTALQDVCRTVRSRVPYLSVDRPVAPDARAVRELIDQGAIVAAAERHVAMD